MLPTLGLGLLSPSMILKKKPVNQSFLSTGQEKGQEMVLGHQAPPSNQQNIGTAN